MNKRQVLHERIVAALRRGQTQAAIARELGCSRSVVSSVARRLAELATAPPPPQLQPAPPAAQPTDPRERLESIRNQWLLVAERSQEVALEKAATGKAANQCVIQAGIATQRAMEISRWIELGDGIPDELPADDDEARREIRRAWWRAATLGGSAAAMTKLAASYGIKAQRGQAIKVEFERPADPNAPAPPAPPVPGGGAPLQ